MAGWEFKRETTTKFGKITGRVRVRIAGAEMTTSKNGNDMIKLTLDVSGHAGHVWDYIVFMTDRPEITNRKFTAIYDSFGIPEGNFDLDSWIGCVGAAFIKLDESGYEKVAYYIERGRDKDIPAWSEPASSGDSPMGGGEARGYGIPAGADDEDLPF